MVSEEIEASRLVVDDALVASKFLCIREVGDTEVGIPSCEVFDGEGGVAEDLNGVYERVVEDGMVV